MLLCLFVRLDALSSSLCLLEQVRHHSRPACLVAGTDGTPGITMEVLMEWDVIIPSWIVLKGHIGAKDWPVTLPVPQENARQTL